MVKAGEPVDAVIEELAPLLDEGDIIIDAGNSHFPDTARRTEECAEQRACASSASACPAARRARCSGRASCPAATRARLRRGRGDPHRDRRQRRRHPVLRARRPRRRRPLREDGAQRHRVRRHPADRRGVRPAHPRRAASTPRRSRKIFEEWNTGDLESFLIEITAKVLAKTDAADRRPARRRDRRPGRAEGHRPLDRAGRARARRAADRHHRGGLRARRCRRCATSARRRRRRWPGPLRAQGADRDDLVDDIRQALYATKVVAYAQGFAQMRGGVAGQRLEPRPRRDGDDLARRLHHPRPLPQPDPRRLRRARRRREPADGARTSPTPWRTRRTPGGAW